MKKITVKVFLSIAMFVSFIANAQFTEGFESGIPATWTIINGGDVSTWIPVDLSPPAESVAHGGTGVASILWDEDLAHDDYLVTPAITVTAGLNDRISFWGRSRDPLFPEKVDIVLSTTTATAAAFTVTLQANVAPPSGTSYYKYSYDLTPYVGQTIYFALHSTTFNKFIFDVDDFENDAQPFCSEPNANAAGLTQTTADLSWAAISGSVNYEYVLDNNASDPVGSGTSTTATTFNATDLDDTTTYYFHIRSNCGEAGFSVWTTVSFTTLAPFTGCLEAEFGPWPFDDYTPETCNGIVDNVITEIGYAGEYSTVEVILGQTYTFKSSIPTDFITLSIDEGVSGIAYGPTPLTWVSTIDGVVQFYNHADADCSSEEEVRTRSVVCGVPACVNLAATFTVVSNCPAETFSITANITNLGSATSITVTDDQGGTPQTVSATGLVTFGPYDNGDEVILTATNDQTGDCTISSEELTQIACPPLNDDFADAEAITCGGTYTGSTFAATLDEDDAPDGFGADNNAPNVWYSYIGTGTAQSVTLNLCASLYDSSVLVYTGTSGNLTLVAANDDDNTCGALSTTRSRVSFPSNGTSTYYIVIEGFDEDSTGTYSMEVTCGDITPPAVANQNCGTSLAVDVDGINVTSDNSFGDASSAVPTCDLFGTIQDVWFSFVAPASGTVNVLVANGTMTSANFNVYSGACGTLTPVLGSCNSNITTPTTESLTGLTGGNTYYVQVWSNAAEQGTFTLNLADPNMATDSFDTASFRAYPNPVKNILNLSYNKNISNVAVFNLLGQEVITKAVDNNQSQIDMSHLANGTYMVKVTVDNESKTLKVVKQ